MHGTLKTDTRPQMPLGMAKRGFSGVIRRLAADVATRARHQGHLAFELAHASHLPAAHAALRRGPDGTISPS